MMKKARISVRNVLIVILLINCLTLSSQNREQARTFINRTHIALAKIEKEMYHGNTTTYASDTKMAMKLQMVAIIYFKNNDFANAVAYSYKSRKMCIDVCNQMNINEVGFYALTADEQTYCNPANYTSMKFKTVSLSADQNQQVDNLNLLDPPTFHAIELGNLK